LTITSGDIRLARKRPNKRRWRSNLLISILIFFLIVAGLVVWSTDNYLWRLPTDGQSSHRALIVDQLALNYPDPSFVTNVTQALTSAGYSVDYAGPSPNAVDMFRQLSAQAYSLIIIRAHQGGGQSIITSEPYSSSEYQSDQQSGALEAADVSEGPLYFAITPKFITDDMQGTLSGTTVIVMGCAALQGTTDLATAFLDKGANYFVGWDGSVTIIHTDISTVNFVQLVSSGRSVPDATRIAGTADPVYGAKLEYVDWNGLVQSRMNTLIAQGALWAVMAALLVFGPLAVFIAPKLVETLDRIRYKAWRGKKHSDSKTES